MKKNYTPFRCQERHVARNFWEQGRFLQIRTQIFGSFESQSKHFQALKSASSESNYLFQMQIILVNIPTRAYNVKIKKQTVALSRALIFQKKIVLFASMKVL